MNIFRYDKHDHLTDFVSFNKKGKLLYFISLRNTTLIKCINECPSSSKDKIYKEISIFSENVCLTTERLNGEYWIRTHKYHPIIQWSYNVRPEKNFFISATGKEIENFTVDTEHINNWADKLKNI